MIEKSIAEKTGFSPFHKVFRESWDQTAGCLEPPATTMAFYAVHLLCMHTDILIRDEVVAP